MKKILVCALALLLVAFDCEDEIEFQDNQRLLLKARLVNSDGNLFQNTPVEVFASREYGYQLEGQLNYNFGELIGSGSSDNNGDVAITALKPLNASNIYTLFNFEGSQAFQTEYAPLIINFINREKTDNNTYDLGEVVIDKALEFELMASRTMNLTDTLRYSWQYNRGVKIIGNNPVSDYYFIDDGRDSGFNELLPTEFTKENTFKVIESDTILIDYQLINNGITASEQLQIIVNEQSGSFEFEF
ncbi:hypothetical protein [Croceitalea vernalis]|uniref:DUF4249 domain-containing protein n=1 Tax=Croceitalea vernalis TaxID=3075599 RepID=A0ABU3BEH9_9FLAO|nr:hypothetical protein [Croceitalea sp. P007]MDT0620551.1 hypothetical protein [Croceitalea sp. P007]